MSQNLSLLYCAILFGVVLFQVALIFGAPWGRVTQGGSHPGALPRSGRIMAGVSIILLILMGLSIRSAAGLPPGWPGWTGWVALSSNALMMVLNWITPSKPERLLWGPITTVIFALAAAVVLG